MSNVQFYLTLGVPFLALPPAYTASVISNRNSINDLRSEMRTGFDALRGEMHRGFDSVNERIGGIEQKQAAMDTEVRLDHDHRLAVLEARVVGNVH